MVMGEVIKMSEDSDLLCICMLGVVKYRGD